MNDRITQALSKLFDRYWIVSWCDTKHELRGDYEVLISRRRKLPVSCCF